MTNRNHFNLSVERVLILSAFTLLCCTILVQSAAITSTTTTTTGTPATNNSASSPDQPSPDPPSPDPPSPDPPSPDPPSPDSESAQSIVSASPTPNWVGGTDAWKIPRWSTPKPAVDAEGASYFPLFPPFPPHLTPDEEGDHGTAEAGDEVREIPDEERPALLTATEGTPATNHSAASSDPPSPDSEVAQSIVFASPTPNWVEGTEPKTWKSRRWPTQKPAVDAEGEAYFPLFPPFPPHLAPDEEDEEATAEAGEEDGEVSDDDHTDLPTVTPQIECPEKEGVQAYAHPEECDQFYLCTNGTLTLERCQNGLLFKGGPAAVHNHCHYHWDVDCQERHKEMVALSTDSCEYQFGMYPETAVEDGCSNKYVLCEFGRARLAACADGLAYDPKHHRCTWPDELMDLKCEPKNIVGFECPKGMPEDPLSARFWPYPRFAIKGDCRRLITCVGGQPRLITCDPGMVVDDSTLMCDEPELVPSCAHFAKEEEH